MKKTCLLFVVDDLSIARSSVCLLQQLIHSLSSNGPSNSEFDIHIVTFCRQDRLPFSAEFPARMHCLPSRSVSVNKLIAIRKTIGELSPDIVHAWGYSSHLLVALALTGIGSTRLQVIYSYFCLPPRRLMIRRWLEEFSTKSPAIVTTSHQMIADELLADGFNNSVVVIPNCFIECESHRDQARYRLRRLAGIQTDNVFLAGAVCGWEPRFRLKDLIWATDIMYCVRDDVHLLIFGFGSGIKELNRFLRRTEASNNVHFLDAREFRITDLAGLDAYWNAQSDEANPAAMLTAMSQGVPAISVVNQATADAVLPMQTGLGTNRGARDEFARWTKYLIEQPGQTTLIRNQSQTHVQQNFPVRQMVDGFRRLYASTK